MPGEIDILARAHALFDGAPGQSRFAEVARPAASGPASGSTGVMADAYRQAAARRWAEWAASVRTDDDLTRVLAAAVREHGVGRVATAAVLAAARADPGWADNPIAAREVLRRRVARLRAQHRHVADARRRSRRRRAALLALRYGRGLSRGGSPDQRAMVAVRAALSRLGRPYVWGATGPDQFDCSGLVKWAYAQAGVGLHRTTYEQINDGVPVPRSAVRAGDLVFPHAGHVQLAIGPSMVVEAPYAGATVRISPLGADVAIRRVL